MAAVQRSNALGEKGPSILLQAGDESVKKTATRLGRNRADHHQPCDPGAAVSLQVSQRFAIAHRVADERDVAEVESVDDCREIVCQSVVVIAVPRIGGPSMAAPIIGHTAQTLVGQLDELVLPDVGIESPGMGEKDRIAGSPIEVEQARTVLGLDEGR